MKRHRLGTAIVLAVVGASGFAGGEIVRRHEREDAKYLELGARYRSVTRLAGGTATLIEPQWLLTAGHVVASLSPFDRFVEFNGKRYAIEAVATHPDWKPKGRLKAMDLALVKLAEPVTGVTPARIYEERDEGGRGVVLVGPGRSGDGLTGPILDDGKWRGATNTVNDVSERWITFAFDAPPGGDELEGISGPGDSGGPAFVEVAGATYIIGVSSANDDQGAAGPCRYGSTEYYARVSAGAGWVRATIKADLPRQKAFDVRPIDLASGGWPESAAGRAGAAFFEAYAKGTDAAMEGFEREHRAQASLKARPVEARLASWREYRAEWGVLRAAKCAPGAEGELYVLVRAEREGVWKTFRFVMEAKEPFRLTGIEIASPTTAGE